ncbi:MAG: KilA-N domain-containing protein [Bacilli bacterium]|nr:KilA-N domain-containing protein [Bacilli bacterium]
MKKELIKKKLDVKGNKVCVMKVNGIDYISLTDIAKTQNDGNPADIIKNWIRNKDTISFLGVWEELNNPNFKLVEFDQFENKAGKHSFTMSPQKWIKRTNALGIISKSGNNGGTYAHSNIAFEFHLLCEEINKVNEDKALIER